MDDTTKKNKTPRQLKTRAAIEEALFPTTPAATESVPQPTQEPVKKACPKRCPNGTRCNKKTGNCDPVASRATVKKRPSPVPAPTPITIRPIEEPTPVPQPPTNIPIEEPVAVPVPEEEPPKLTPQELEQATQELRQEFAEEITQSKTPMFTPSIPKVEYPDPEKTQSPPSPSPKEITPVPDESSTIKLDQELVPPLVDQEGTAEPVIRQTSTSQTEFHIPQDSLYPSLDDPDFNLKIANRKEFQDTKYSAPITSIEEEQNQRCMAEFEIFPHQSFIKNFLSTQTPYNSVLVYAGLGTGKTCTAIGIAEEMRSYIKQVGLNKQVIILAQPNVLDNFRLQLFDDSRLKMEAGEWNIQSCVGKSILDEINPTELKSMNRQRIIQNVQAIIRTYYEFKGYIKFANDVAEALQPFPTNDPRRIKRIQSMFDNSLIIVDEVHNVRMTTDNETNMSTASYLYMIAKIARNVRFVLLSATPMYNSYKEIIWLTNLMNANDRRGEITADQVFQKDGEFRSGGRELLKRKLTGYVSYVRGENPYSFPFRIYMTADSQPHMRDATMQSLSASTLYRTNYQETTKPPKYPPIYVSKIESIQEESYKKILNEISDILASRAKSAEGATTTSPSSPVEDKIRESLETLDNIGYEQLQLPIQALNIVYGGTEGEESASNMVGSQGLRTIVRDVKGGQFEYHEEAPHIFRPDQIAKYSKKIATILEKIQTAERGITLIYSEFLDAGVVPMAMALEEAGFSRFSGTRGEQNRSMFVTTQPTAKKYAMITGNSLYSPNNKDELRTITAESNKNGEQIQVVLITRAGAEGIDFKNIRQVHIMEPWYNMSRIEQIIGRGVRNGSHCALPFKDRNVEIYMHATQTADGTPSADMYLYEFAFKKAQKIGKVSRLLKQTAIDCILNKEQHNFTPDKLSTVPENRQIELDTPHGPYTIQPGDQPYTAICDYAESCQIGCDPDQEDQKTNVMTYGLDYLTTNHVKIIQHIRQLFQKQSFYPIDVFIRKIQEQSATVKYSQEQIYYCLTYLIQNRNREFLYDKNGRRGFLINRGEIYAFQPVEITDESSTIFDRTFPIMFRPSKVILEVPSKFLDKEPLGLVVEENGATATVAPPSVSIKRRAPAPTKKPIETIPEGTTSSPAGLTQPSKYIQLANGIQNHIDTISGAIRGDKAIMKIPATKRTDYIFIGLILPKIRDKTGISEEQVMEYMIDHALDEMSLYDKLELANGAVDQEHPLTSKIAKYFEKRTYIDGKYLLLTDNQNNIVVYVKRPPATTWNLAKPSEIDYATRNIINPIKQRLTPYQSKVATVAGFFVADDPKDPNTNFILKVKDFTKETKSKNAKGENLKKAGKKRALEIAIFLGELLGIEIDESIGTTMNLGELAIFIETLLRNATETGKGVYYLTPEEYAIVKF